MPKNGTSTRTLSTLTHNRRADPPRIRASCARRAPARKIALERASPAQRARAAARAFCTRSDACGRLIAASKPRVILVAHARCITSKISSRSKHRRPSLFFFASGDGLPTALAASDKKASNSENGALVKADKQMQLDKKRFRSTRQTLPSFSQAAQKTNFVAFARAEGW